MAHGKNKKNVKYPLLLLALLAVAALLVILTVHSGAALLGRGKDYSLEELAAAEGKIQVDGQWYRKKRYIQTCLILGIDKADMPIFEGNVNNQQNDFNALMVINLEDKTYTVVYLNRDTMTQVQRLDKDGSPMEGKREQLALAHTYGSGGEDSCRNAVQTVSKMLYSAPIDHYAVFSLDSIGIINDAVGGVTVKIEDDFSRVDPTLVMGETVKLNAAQAETFVRGRWGVADQTNVNRMSRQKTYLSAWREQAFAMADSDGMFFADLAAKLGEDLVTDMSVQKISDMGKYLHEFKALEPRQPEGRSVRGEKYMEYQVDEDALMDLVLELFFDKVK